MIGNGQPQGPAKETLEFLKANLPNFIKGLVAKKLTGKGAPVSINRPRKACKLCGKAFDYGPNVEGQPLKLGPCPECDSLLKEGYMGITDGDRYLFAKSTTLLDLAGKITPVSAKTMDKLEAHFQAKQLEKDHAGDDSPSIS